MACVWVVPLTLLVVELVRLPGVPMVTVPEPVMVVKSIPLPAATLVTEPVPPIGVPFTMKLPEMFTSPVTSSLYAGVAFPIPTLPPSRVYPVPLGVSVIFWLVPPAVKVRASVPVMEPVMVPVPPLATGTVLRLITGVVVPVATLMGDVPVTFVTVPLPVPAPIAVLKSKATLADCP